MTSFSAETFQNEYLPSGSVEVNAIVTVTGTSDGPTTGPVGKATEILVVDTSGSMGGAKLVSAKQAAKVAVDALRDGVRFAIIAGTGSARRIYPTFEPLAICSPATRKAAQQAIDQLVADGGTAMSSWLALADELFATAPPGVKHAILLTDGVNEHDTPGALEQLLAQVSGRFQCDCRGVGTDWKVAELRTIATALLGTVDIVASPSDLAADFAAMIDVAMGKSAPDVRLRLWIPAGATVAFVKQVAPSVQDLTGRRIDVNARSGDYPTGAWGAEARDFHVCVRVAGGVVGDEMLACRASVVTTGPDGADVIAAQSLVRALWTEDEALSTRINRQVAHYTGQAELASAIAEGLEARKSGDERTATMKLGRAAQLAAASGNTATQALLERVVDIEDAATGTVRLKRRVEAADEMALDTRSTRTLRVGRSG